jgi:hypothetical protein
MNSSVNKIFVWICWFFGSQIHNSTRAMWSVGYTAWTVDMWQGYRPNSQRDGISFRRLYLDGAQPRCQCSDLNRQCVLVICYVSFARIYRFLWDFSAPCWKLADLIICVLKTFVIFFNYCYCMSTFCSVDKVAIAIHCGLNCGQWASENRTIGIRTATTGSATRSEAFRPQDGVEGIAVNTDMDLAARLLLFLAVLSAALKFSHRRSHCVSDRHMFIGNLKI